MCTGQIKQWINQITIHVHVLLCLHQYKSSCLFTVSLRWKLLAAPSMLGDNMPYQRYGHSAVAFEDCAYVWGGRNDTNGACNILYRYNTGNIAYLTISLFYTIKASPFYMQMCRFLFHIYYSLGKQVGKLRLKVSIVLLWEGTPVFLSCNHTV